MLARYETISWHFIICLIVFDHLFVSVVPPWNCHQTSAEGAWCRVKERRRTFWQPADSAVKIGYRTFPMAWINWKTIYRRDHHFSHRNGIRCMIGDGSPRFVHRPCTELHWRWVQSELPCKMDTESPRKAYFCGPMRPMVWQKNPRQPDTSFDGGNHLKLWPGWPLRGRPIFPTAFQGA